MKAEMGSWAVGRLWFMHLSPRSDALVGCLRGRRVVRLAGVGAAAGAALVSPAAPQPAARSPQQRPLQRQLGRSGRVQQRRAPPRRPSHLLHMGQRKSWCIAPMPRTRTLSACCSIRPRRCSSSQRVISVRVVLVLRRK
jgi:hypothetical protein